MVRWKLYARIGCFGGGLALLAGAAVLEQGALRAAWSGEAAQELPAIPEPSSTAPPGRPPARYQPIHARFGPPPKAPVAPVDTLPFRVTGGFVDLGGASKYVRIRSSVGKERAYRQGETVDVDQAKILSIDAKEEKVRVLWRSAEYELKWDRKRVSSSAPAASATPGPSGGPASATEFEITKAQFEEYVNNFFSKYWTQGRYQVLPDVGIKIVHLDESAEAKKFGMRMGDILKGVNGHKFTSIAEFTKTATELTKDAGDSYALDVEREGKPFQIRMKVKP